MDVGDGKALAVEAGALEREMRDQLSSHKRYGARDGVKWDVPLGKPIEYFDPSLSYELTGYRPINETHGLDFDPRWFTETRETFERTGSYCQFPYGTKAFDTFWKEQYRRCKFGMTVNGYTITGHHYYFLNFYRVKDLTNVYEAGSGRIDIFPHFLEGQYEWFHYLKMAQRLRLNAQMVKARSMGFTEIEAAVVACSYTVTKGSVNAVCTYADVQLNKLMNKIEENLAFLDDNTGGGFSHGRVVDTDRVKKSGQFKMENGRKIPVGWGSSIEGYVVNKAAKLRGDRTDVLVFDEAGVFPGLTQAYTQSEALVGRLGRQFGIRIVGGTGGESGPMVQGMRTMCYNPRMFGVLPHRHNYVQTGETVYTSFFLPAFKSIKEMDLVDSRGFISDSDGKAYFDPVRDLKKNDAQEYRTYCAEYCYTLEECFSLEGDNRFNQVSIAEQLTTIRALKLGPRVERGYLEYTYRDGVHTRDNISGFKWIENQSSPLRIVEHPLWTLPERRDENGNVVWTPPDGKVNDLYVIGIDGIDISKRQTSDATKNPSDFCLVVYRRAYGIQEPQFVALYRDRPQNDIRDAYKMSIKLAQYYNARINIEATRQSIIPYAREQRLLNLFMRRPRATLAENARNTNRQFGTPATRAIIDHQVDLIADYVNDYCHMIWFDEMLDELNRYTDEAKRKFDIIVAMGMALLADEELQGVVPKDIERQERKWRDIGIYYDADGVKRYGVIPERNQEIMTNNDFGPHYDDTGRARTSNPRAYFGYI